MRISIIAFLCSLSIHFMVAQVTSNPSTASKGQTLNIMFSGASLNMQQGSETMISLEQGSNVMYSNSVQVISPTQAIANFYTASNCGLFNTFNFYQGSNVQSFSTNFTVDCSSLIEGFVFNDLNNDGVYDFNTEPLMSNVGINLSPLNIANATNHLGSFHYNVTPGTYQVSATAPKYYSLTTSSSVPTAVSASVSSIVSFGMRAGVHNDLTVGLYGPNPRIGYGRSYWIGINNVGTTSLTPLVEIELPALMSIASCDYPYTSLGNNKYSINLSGVVLFPNEWKSFGIELMTSTTATTGATCKIITRLTNTLDETPSDNTSNAYFTYSNSFDPNDKSVLPSRPNNEVLKTETLEYLIRFQNTGNDVAYTVRVEDQLSDYLDLSTFKVLGSSHVMQYNVQAETKKVTFLFNNINLPDSGSNQKESNGYIKYSVKCKPTIADNTLVTNKASIYFDFNTPVITNTTTSKAVQVLSSIQNNSKDLDVLIYPNPILNQKLIIKSKEGIIKELEIFALDGKLMMSKKMDGFQNEIDLNMISNGFYFIKIQTSKGDYNQKIQVLNK